MEGFRRRHHAERADFTADDPALLNGAADTDSASEVGELGDLATRLRGNTGPSTIPTLDDAPLSPVALRKRITEAGVSEIFDIQLIERLVQNGKLHSDRIAQFIAEAASKGTDLSTHALTSMMAGEADLVAITAELYGMEPVVLSETAIEEDIALLISSEQAQDWRVLPYTRTSLGNLRVAIADPRNQSARQNLQLALPRETIEWRFALESELSLALDRVYSNANSAASVAETVAEVAEETQRDERFTVRDTSVDSGIVKLVNSIIARAHKEDASDIHIEPKEHHTEVRFRIDGVLRPAMNPLPRGDSTKQMVARIKTLANMKTDERRLPQDGRVTIGLGGKTVDLRIVSVPTIYGEQITMRLLDQERAMLSLEQLGMSKDNLNRYEQAIRQAHGCCIITGPTGSGKSTTLYSSATRVVTPEKKFISIEDPVEYRLGGITQIDVSGHGEKRMTFASALRAILRSDPDIVMVGEIRDQETALIAVEAALTGHFLYSTLHTNDALSTITRLQRLGVEPYLVAEAVAVIVAQRLVRRLCPECKIPFQADLTYLQGLHAPPWALKKAESEQFQLHRARENGCNACRGTGYKGRTGVHEVISMNDELRTAIVAGKSQDELERLVRGQRMGSLRDDCFGKVWAGMTSMEELARVVL